VILVDPARSTAEHAPTGAGNRVQVEKGSVPCSSPTRIYEIGTGENSRLANHGDLDLVQKHLPDVYGALSIALRARDSAREA
jgi:hypothetical protein